MLLCHGRFSRLRASYGLALLLGVSATVACSEDAESTPPIVTCGTPPFAISVRITDAGTGRYVASGATVIASSGSYSDVRRLPSTYPDSSPVLLGENAGTYTLIVSKPGYMDWTRGGLVVKPSAAPCEGFPGERLFVEAVVQRSP